MDLLVGGTLGPWAIAQARPAEVTQVVTDDPSLVRLARSRGFAVCDGQDWQPSPRGLSVHYQRIVPADTIDRYERLWNLHPGFLPWGRGFYPVFWALWERSPAGATLHEIASRLDAGPIVERIEVPVLPDDTGGSLHTRVQAAEQTLFTRWWPRMVAGETIAATPQPSEAGSVHTRSEFFELKRGGWRALTAPEQQRLKRCLDFPGRSQLE